MYHQRFLIHANVYGEQNWNMHFDSASWKVLVDVLKTLPISVEAPTGSQDGRRFVETALKAK